MFLIVIIATDIGIGGACTKTSRNMAAKLQLIGHFLGSIAQFTKCFHQFRIVALSVAFDRSRLLAELYCLEKSTFDFKRYHAGCLALLRKQMLS